MGTPEDIKKVLRQLRVFRRHQEARRRRWRKHKMPLNPYVNAKRNDYQSFQEITGVVEVLRIHRHGTSLSGEGGEADRAGDSPLGGSAPLDLLVIFEERDNGVTIQDDISQL